MFNWFKKPAPAPAPDTVTRAYHSSVVAAFNETISGLDATARMYKRQRDAALAELAPLKAAKEKQLANLRQNRRKGPTQADYHAGAA